MADTTKTVISRKAFRTLIMPKVGDKLPSGDNIIYVHQTGMWFSVIGTAVMDTKIELDDKMFQVTRINGNKYSCNFIGFKDNPVAPEAPETNNDEVIKVI